MLANPRRLAAIAVGIAVLVALVSAVAHGWTPIYDDALIELRVSDVPAHLPLVGAFSRFGWNHPGPAQFYYLSVFYWLGGRSSEMLLVGAVVMHLLFGLLAWWMAKRISPTAGALVACGALSIMATTGPTAIRDPWNPYVATLGGLALCCAAWSLAERHRAGALALLPIGSFLIQAHVVTAPFVVTVIVAAAACMFTSNHRSIPWRQVASGLVIALLMWVPPIIQQLTNGPGNFTKLIRTEGPGYHLGLAGALKAMTNALALWPDVLNPTAVGRDELPTSWVFPVWGVVFMGALVLLIHRRDRVLLRGAVIATAALVGSTVGMAMISGSAFNYLALTRRSAVVFAVVICVSTVLSEYRVTGRLVSRVAYGSCALLALVIALPQVGAENPLQPVGPAIDHFVDAVRTKELPREIGLELKSQDLYAGEAYFALILALERNGYDIKPLSVGDIYVGAHRVTGSPGYTLIVSPIEDRHRLESDGWKTLSVYQPFDENEQSRLAELQLDLDGMEQHGVDSDAPRDSYVTRWNRTVEQIEHIRRGRVDLVLSGRPTDRDAGRAVRIPTAQTTCGHRGSAVDGDC